MKKLVLGLVLGATAILIPVQSVIAQEPITEIISAGIKKVIKAVDLKIQRMQNETIWLQNAQKIAENAMSELKLNEIADWVEKQRILYKDYFDELWKVKNVVFYYHRIRETTEKQVRLVEEYKRAWALFKQDKHFTEAELSYMAEVYTGILDESVKNLDQLFLVVNSFSTQISDAKRIEIINDVADGIETNYNDLKSFTQGGIVLSLQRAKTKTDVDAVKQLYGLK